LAIEINYKVIRIDSLNMVCSSGGFSLIVFSSVLVRRY